MTIESKTIGFECEKSFEIRDYKSGDEMAICVLFEKVFGKPMGKTESLRHWQWEFLENPAGGLFIKLAWDKEKLVGQYTAGPLRVHADGKDIFAALSHDTMTDQEYGRLGIFRNTAEDLYKDQQKAGYAFIFGFPNRNSIHGFIRSLHWQRIMPVPVHVRPVSMISGYVKRLFNGKQSASVSKSAPFLCNEPIVLPDKLRIYELRVESVFGDWVDDLWQRCHMQHLLWVVRDQAYLNWRYVRRPESNYNIVSVWRGTKAIGYVVTTCVKKKFGNVSFVLDFMVDLDFKEAAGMLIRHVINKARQSGSIFASVLLTPGSRYREVFRRYLFLPLFESLFPQPLYFGARCFESSLSKIIFDPKAWSISWGDDDVL